MSRRAKVTFLLSVGTILNLFGYLYITGSWRMFFNASVPKDIYPKSIPIESQGPRHFEADLREIVHRAMNVQNLSHKNLTKLVNSLVQEELHDNAYIEDGRISGRNNSVGKTNLLEQQKNIAPKGEVEAKQESRPGASNKDLKKPIAEAAEAAAVALGVDRSAESNKDTPKFGDGAKNDTVAQPVVRRPIDPFVHSDVVVNPHNFNYQINEPQKCFNEDGTEREVFLLVLICTVHNNFENRNAIRQSWGSPEDIDGHKVITMFLLAKRSDPKLQRAVAEESEQYHDIIMEDFDDTYKNLTLKTIMGMKWMTLHCPHAKYMMKTDDDMWVSYANLVKYLYESPDKGFVTGMVINGKPIRNPKSKWYMPKELYKEAQYPPFCSGTGYAMSGDMPPKIYQTSLSTPYLYLEDVYVATCLHKLKVVPKNHKEFHNWRTTYQYCHYKRILTAHMVTPTQMLRYWSDQNSNKRHKC